MAVGWVFFRADSLPQALDYLAAMVRLGGSQPADVPLAILRNAQTLGALAAGTLLAAPLLPAVMQRLRVARAEARRGADLPRGAGDRRGPLPPVPLLAAGFVLSLAILAGSTLNPFLYFRF